MDMEEDFPIRKAKARVEDSAHKKEKEKARVKAIPRAVDVADLLLVEAEDTAAPKVAAITSLNSSINIR